MQLFPCRSEIDFLNQKYLFWILSVFIRVHPWFQAPERAKRLPGLTATPPLRHRGQSDAS
jgi:hypothetical protein